MPKLIPMDEAAQMLGVTVEDLNEMRSKSEIFGYRDGSSWKFKEDEIKRVASLRAADEPAGTAAGGIDSGIDDDLDRLVDVSELDDSAGKVGQDSADDEFVLADDLELDDETGDKPSTVSGANDELVDDGDLTLDAGVDELQLASDDSDVLDLSHDPGRSQQQPAAAEADRSDTAIGADQPSTVDTNELRLAPDEDFELSTAERVTDDEQEQEDDDFELSDAGLDLDASSEDDLVLDGPGTVDTLDDDGILLEESPTQFASSADDLVLSDDDMLMDDGSDASQIKADDDFLLTPVDSESAIDESDSGSQVIELDEDFEASDEPLITEAGDDDRGLEEPAEAVPLRASMEPKTEYSVWNVLGLVLIVLLFLPTAVMMIDLMRNMWSWSGTNALSSSMMDSILSMFGA